LNNSNVPNQKQLAIQLGVDQSQLINYKKLNNLIPELQSLVENDGLKATTAYKICRCGHRSTTENNDSESSGGQIMGRN
jgi:hypothetical protein